MKSSPPPAARCTMKRTGLFGQSCARTTCGASRRAERCRAFENVRRPMVMLSSNACFSVFACSPDGAKRNPGPVRRMMRKFLSYDGVSPASFAASFVRSYSFWM